MLLFTTQNLVSEQFSEGAPWDWEPDAMELLRVRAMTKIARRNYLTQANTKWNVYSCFRGIVGNRHVSADNPPAGIRAFAADFDAQLSPEAAIQCMAEQPHNLMPNWLEVTLGGKLRAIWLFEQEFNCASMAHADAMSAEVAKLVKAERLLPAYDKASVRSTMAWSNGGVWYELEGTHPLSATILHGLACDAAKKVDFGRAEIDIARIGEEVARRYPNRWVGDFSLDSVGVRFWDPAADNPRGAMVKPTGCYCLTGGQTFVSWDEIFGSGWVREHRAAQFGEAAQEVYFDGKKYWRKIGEPFAECERNDIMLYFASRGLTRTARRGENVSEAENVLLHVQNQNRVEGAIPLIFRPPGMQLLNGSRMLNISTLKALPPAVGAATEVEFPWIWDFLHQLIPNRHARHTWLAWMLRTYKGALDIRPTVGQALFLCGPKSNGKSLFCTRIISALLGGKMANPYDYLMKATMFNDDLFGSAVLAINDEDAPRTEREKEIFLQRVKSMVVNQRHQFHAKFGKRIDIEWVGGRLVVTLNDDPKSMGMLPEVNSNTEDKVIFIKTEKYNKMWPEQYDLEATIAKELPFFARWLLDSFVPDEGILAPGTRAGIHSFHDPLLVEMSKQQESAYELRELLVTWFKTGAYWQDGAQKGWSGSPTELFSIIAVSHDMTQLVQDWTVSRMARSLRSLAGLDDGAVNFVQGSQRCYRVDKEALMRKHEIHLEVEKDI
jgi:hypothetical protein